MDPDRRAAAGLALAAAAQLGVAGLLFQFFGPSPVALTWLGAQLGLLLAAGGVAALRLGHGLGAMAAGFAVAAASLSAFVALALGGAGLWIFGAALAAVGMVQAAWYAVLWWAAGEADAAGEAVGAARAESLRLSAWASAVGYAVFAILSLGDGFPPFAALHAVAAAGFALAGSTRGVHLHHLGASGSEQAGGQAAEPPLAGASAASK